MLSFERNRSSSKNAVNVWFSLKNFASDWGFLSYFLAIFPLGVLWKFQNDWTTATISEICSWRLRPQSDEQRLRLWFFFGQISVPKMVHASFGSWLFTQSSTVTCLCSLWFVSDRIHAYQISIFSPKSFPPFSPNMSVWNPKGFKKGQTSPYFQIRTLDIFWFFVPLFVVILWGAPWPTLHVIGGPDFRQSRSHLPPPRRRRRRRHRHRQRSRTSRPRWPWRRARRRRRQRRRHCLRRWMGITVGKMWKNHMSTPGKDSGW